LNGKIEIESEPGGGTSFFVCIPKVAQKQIENEAKATLKIKV